MELEKQITQTKLQQKLVTKQISVTNTLIARLDNLEHQIQSFVVESSQDFSSISLSVNNVLSYKIDKEPLREKLKALSSDKVGIDELT